MMKPKKICLINWIWIPFLLINCSNPWEGEAQILIEAWCECVNSQQDLLDQGEIIAVKDSCFQFLSDSVKYPSYYVVTFGEIKTPEGEIIIANWDSFYHEVKRFSYTKDDYCPLSDYDLLPATIPD